MLEFISDNMFYILIIVGILLYKAIKYFIELDDENQKLKRQARKKLRFQLKNKSRKWRTDEDFFRCLEYNFELNIENVGLDKIYINKVEIKPLEDKYSSYYDYLDPIKIDLEDFFSLDPGENKTLKFKIAAEDSDDSLKDISHEVEAMRNVGARIRVVDNLSDEIFSDVIKPEILPYLEDPECLD